MARIDRAFAEVIGAGFDPGGDEDWERLGLAYTDLMAVRDLLMVMMHGVATGGIEERIHDFLTQGMLMKVLLSMRAPEHLDERRGAGGRAVHGLRLRDALAFVTGPPGPPGPRAAHH